ncbi:MAG: hypothetical protein VKK32_09380 [Candidatus Melainabacteria bacterium]|nr:hypothetical protein [Candidatus Melainabacteria bacterium]
MQNTNPTSTSKRALDTIKLIGSQIIEIREILNRQVDTIQMLEQEVKKLRSLGRDNEQNIKILQIDQRDIVKQLRKVRESSSQMGQVIDSVEMTHEDATDMLFGKKLDLGDEGKLSRGHVDQLLSYDEKEVAERFYPNYKNSKIIEKHERNQPQSNSIKQKINKKELSQRVDSRLEMLEKEAMERKKSERFSFDRIPRLLNLD